MFITKVFTFDAAHHLPNYQGKCKNLHGHTYKLEVTLSGELERTSGMLIDFAKLKKIVKEDVLKEMDHAYLNDILKNPTAENLINLIWKKLDLNISKQKKDIFLYELKLWETPTSYVILRSN
ncbi:6-carboxytetrahydropterin synthase QueD [Candidatus Falkowbacteria bacterium]|nr:6-carboxytetrahydropterin synthase QueD [Candidatus Falkowbacteria bacterium]